MMARADRRFNVRSALGTINNPRDFGIGKRLQNLAALRQVGFQANRRLLSVEHVSHDCHLGEAAWTDLTQPKEINGQRVSALHFDDPRLQALLCALVHLHLMPTGFRNGDLRQHWAPLLGKAPSDITPGSMSYQLRRLRLRGIIARAPKTNRYSLTDSGLRTALFFTRTMSRLLRPGLSIVLGPAPPGNHRLRRDFDRMQGTIDDLIREAKLAA